MPPPVQYCSTPALQFLHSRQESTKQPTPDPVADREFAYLRTDLGDDAGDLMAGHHRVAGLTPLGAHGVDIGVADPGEVDVESDVVWADVAAGDRGLGQWFGGRRSGIGGERCS